MDHHDHVALLRPGIPAKSGNWADFGAGSGAFTLALAEILDLHSQLISVDKSQVALEQAQRAVNKRFPGCDNQIMVADFTRPLKLPLLDGLVLANALHFFHEKEAIVSLLSSYLRPGGRFIIVEYNTDRGNHWVPYPFSFITWKTIAQRCELQDTTLMVTRPSSFLGEFYSAVSFVEATGSEQD